MITPAYVQAMAKYNAELNRRFYAAASRLPSAKLTEDGGAFWSSIQGTLCHILWADRLWMSRFGAGEPPTVPLPESSKMVATFAELDGLRKELDQVIIDWSSGLGPEQLEGDITWHSRAIEARVTKPRAICIVQLFNHQTHHRGQVHGLITRAGERTGDTDLPFVL